MTINTLPTAPLRTMSPADFVAAANTFLAALPTFSSQVNSDLSALLTLSQLVSTSTTSLTIGTGSKSLTVQTAKAYLANQAVRIYSTATPDNYMDGTVTSYDSGTGALVVNVTATNGSGTLTAWTVILNGGLATTVDLNAAVALRALLAGSASQVFSVAPATAETHAPQAAQIQSGALVAITATLTGTEYAATPSPAITAYATNQAFDVTFASACPAAPTLKLNGIATPPNLVRRNLDGTYSNLAAGAFPAGWRSTVRAISASQVLVDVLPPRTYQGTFTRDLSLAAGTVTISGLPFYARKIRFYAQIPGTLTGSVGEYAPGVSACRWSSSVAAQDNVSSTSSILAMSVSSSSFQSAVVSLVSATAFDLTWSKTGSPTGTLSVVYVIEE